MEGGLINPPALIRSGAAKGVTSLPLGDELIEHRKGSAEIGLGLEGTGLGPRRGVERLNSGA